MDLVVPSLLGMVRERKSRPVGPTQNIDEDGRREILRRMEERSPPMKKRHLASECGVTASAITLLLSKPIPKGEVRACNFLDKIQKALDMPVTGASVPLSAKRETLRRAQRIAAELERNPAALEHWLQDGEFLTGKR